MPPRKADLEAPAEQANREGVWRAAAERAGAEAARTPRGTGRGAEAFSDGEAFAPENPAVHLAPRPIKKPVP